MLFALILCARGGGRGGGGGGRGGGGRVCYLHSIVCAKATQSTEIMRFCEYCVHARDSGSHRGVRFIIIIGLADVFVSRGENLFK